jgi:decaprenyl-phosphate phosphoribosyltransferase
VYGHTSDNTARAAVGGLAGEPEEIALRDRVLQLLALAWIGTVGAAVILS